LIAGGMATTDAMMPTDDMTTTDELTTTDASNFKQKYRVRPVVATIQ
jgi:hypothetical protein